MMGYYIESKKINVILSEPQQKEIFKIWSQAGHNPPLWNKDILEVFADSADITMCLDMLGFKYETKGSGLQLKSLEAKMRQHESALTKIGHLITPGSYITLKGEDGAIFGWFFHGKLTHFEGYRELKRLKEPFMMQEKLDKKLAAKAPKTLAVKI